MARTIAQHMLDEPHEWKVGMSPGMVLDHKSYQAQIAGEAVVVSKRCIEVAGWEVVDFWRGTPTKVYEGMLEVDRWHADLRECHGWEALENVISALKNPA